MLSQRVRLSPAAFDVAWEACGHQLRHNALLIPSPGGTEEDRAMVRWRGLDELARVGLAAGPRLHPDLVSALAVLAQPERECYGWANAPELGPTACSLLAARRGQEAVLVVLTPDAVTLKSVPPAELPDALVAALPPARPAPIRPLSFAEADLARHGVRAGSVLVEALPETRVPPAVRAARELLARPRTGGGVLHAAARNAMGRRHRAPAEVTYLDLHPEGRILCCPQPSSEGLWISLSSGTAVALTSALRSLGEAADRA